MAFLGGLFKKKPGGTFFGNLFRGVSSAATGGILGNGGNRVEVGQTQTNNQLAQAAAAAAGQTLPNPALVAAGQVAGNVPAVQEGVGKTVMAKAAPFLIGAGVITLLVILWKVFTGKRKTSYSRY